MTEAGTILKMIETADPADTAKPDEIDARVWCYLSSKPRFSAYRPRYEALGNSMAVPVIRWIGGRLGAPAAWGI
jgi:hypothetical protein